MKWKQDKDDNTTKSRKSPFLVLPKIEVLCKDKPPSISEMPSKNPNLRLFTKTWPIHQNPHHHHHHQQHLNHNQKEIESARPLTATLEKPQILDINLVTKIDMSLIRKEFLCIANLCRVPLDTLTPLSSSNTRARRTNKALNNNYNGVISSGTGNQSRRSRPSPTNRPLSLSSSRAQLKKTSRPCTSEDSWEDERSSSSQTCSSLSSKKSPKMHKIKSPKSNPVISPIKQQRTNDNDANNNNNGRLNNINSGFKTFRIPNKKRTVRISVIDKTSETNVNKLPQPCKTCGRVDQPERLHSHPETPLVAPNKLNEKITVIKNTVQKPVAIKYKSKLNDKRRTASSPVKKATEVAAKSPPEMIKKVSSKVPVNVSNQTVNKRVASAKGPRTLTCYICGREFGTMSLPLHEPKCMELPNFTCRLIWYHATIAVAHSTLTGLSYIKEVADPKITSNNHLFQPLW
ncbi:zinc-finger of a c2hc-type [Holotrichia oblita]|uniref:Zinc-finger of a c2hc-type n=1 Tax=Holotrichia oblita TaxID=644536 RepID=A0ACB9TJI0_HOLOL|nr:zinc-finger of a c2hc-type [Holotrichia oblita]